MPRIPSDSECPHSDFPLIVPGKYLVEVKDCRNIKKTGEPLQDKAGNEMWNVKLAIVGSDFEGRIVFDNIVFSSKLEGRTKDIFNAFGFDTHDGLEATSPQMLIGKSATARIITETYKDKPMSKVDFFDGYENPNVPSEQEEEIPF